jgi:hypothetical protein
VFLINESLSFGQTVEMIAKLHQLPKSARLYYLTIFEHQYSVAVLYCAQPMRYWNRYLLTQNRLKVLKHYLFSVSIQSTSELVEQKEIRFFDETSAECDSLFLSSRDLPSFLADFFIIA